MVRNTVVLVLCALAAAASAAHIRPATRDIQLSHAVAHHDAFVKEAEQLIADLEAQVDSLMKEALMNHRLAVLSGLSDENCISVAFNGALEAVARLLKIIDEVRGIVKTLSVDVKKCGWNPMCYVNAVTKSFNLLKAIKSDTEDLISTIKAAVDSVKKCVNPPKPTTPAPTAAPTQAPTEAPTQAPTDAPTQAPTDAPTEAPTDAPTDAPTEAPTEAPTDAPTDAPSEAPEEPTEAPAVDPQPADQVKVIDFPASFH